MGVDELLNALHQRPLSFLQIQELSTMGFAFQAISPYFLLERTQGRMQQNGKAGNPA
jgi:hypothetical protein